MVAFIDGPQLVGKSTLINYLTENYNFNVYKFSFGKYSKEFNLTSKKEIKGFQIGKDLSTLYWLKELTNGYSNLLVDRGIFSTLYYSYLLKRMKKKDLKKLLDELTSYDEFTFVFVISKNNSIEQDRDKKDGFDNLPKTCDEKALNFIKREAKKRNIDLKIFYNDFSKSIKENGENLKKILYKE